MNNRCMDCDKEMVSPKAKRCWGCTILFRKSKPSKRSGECDFCHKTGPKNRAYRAESDKKCCGCCYNKFILAKREEYKKNKQEYDKRPEVMARKKEHFKKYSEKHREEINARNRQKRLEDPKYRERRNLQTKQWFEKNKDNPERIAKYNAYFVKRHDEDINYRLASNLRKRLGIAIKNNQKGGSAIRDLGCSIEEFKKYVESLFQPNMSWDNYGLHGWHIDHKLPLSKFDLTIRDQFLVACHYTNLQPMWAIYNIKKSNKVDQ